ncbi:TadA family conjugal transfer-associated ATPase [Leifsonia sp. F6_8S_P_1B]|uniref:TadA family conjugal transfer-associated ATPase n=1 Tax=Leifsonia williamsii TaxID=3035919 RepID=A0ABT8KA71_9MICO|nr:TadA family conjugal transfer-associated ATPase [Leifsonia williamsii]MDN4614314.1 TadA family conjugal transfer-associated ATPase [Leifsonia williamsii]
MNPLSRHRAGDAPFDRDGLPGDLDATIPRGSVLDTVRREAEGEAPPIPPPVAIPAPGLWSTFGPLTPYLMREGVTDLFITGDGSLWSDGRAGLHRIPEWHADEPETRRLAVDLIARGGRHIDEATPFVDVRLHDGVRVHAVLPPISTGGTLLSIRIPGRTTLRLTDLARLRTITAAQCAALERAVEARTNILVTGASGAGKTTLLAAMLAHAPPGERLVIIEDVAELRVPHPHVVGLQARQANVEGRGGVALRRLVREALRMRPDRLVLGECRGEEVSDLLAALNTGHDGGAGTLHANTLDDVPARLEALGALAGMSDRSLARQAVSAIGLVVHVERTGAGRRVEGFARLTTGADGRLEVARVEVRSP